MLKILTESYKVDYDMDRYSAIPTPYRMKTSNIDDIEFNEMFAGFKESAQDLNTDMFEIEAEEDDRGFTHITVVPHYIDFGDGDVVSAGDLLTSDDVMGAYGLPEEKKSDVSNAIKQAEQEKREIMASVSKLARAWGFRKSSR